MIQFIEGDLITMLKAGYVEALAHGCNCFCKMGAGFALQLATAVPEVLSADLITTTGDLKKLGMYSYVNVNGIDYYNLYTQYNYGRGQVHFDLIAFRTSFVAAINDLIAKGKTSIHIPYIGSNLGGGDWTQILSAIEQIDYNYCKDTFVINIVNKV